MVLEAGLNILGTELVIAPLFPFHASHMRHITAADIKSFERIYRLNLVNGLPGFKPANLVGTAAPDGATNLAVFSSALHLGSDPALLGLVTRPTTVPRHTYANLKASGCYTLNHVPEALAAQAHYTSADFPDTVSEFDECGFTAAFRDGFPAPYVAESPISIGLRLLEEHHLSNGTVLLVGSVEHVYLREEGLREDGTLDLAALGTACISGLDGYHAVQAPVRYGYARPGQPPVAL
ncbi:flavin oxidoreductase [Hymenobacter frigidus]|uniref:Flavin oxidoreductase n=2 Tax=Hymenobacter frigidus TaxID=1524095 RepID=A0ABQ1ZV65_9BACT|nr:flavin oxidoreductase [Hymenobacter frigidus]